MKNIIITGDIYFLSTSGEFEFHYMPHPDFNLSFVLHGKLSEKVKSQLNKYLDERKTLVNPITCETDNGFTEIYNILTIGKEDLFKNDPL